MVGMRPGRRRHPPHPRFATLIRASALDWTLVRPAMLTNGKLRGGYRAATTLTPGLFAGLSRADLAAFMLHEGSEDAYLRQAVAVSQ
ncbi:NAD(P)H-binding protein [Massilia sp. CCM 8734]|nr:NAD(P)H-binding protein [Massilia sp. CCM 8734]